MRDPAVAAATAGLVGAITVDGLTALERLIGVRTMTPWGVAADIFLAPAQARTLGGILLGMVASLFLSIATAFAVYLFLRWAGTDYAELKGVMAAEGIGFVTLGFFAPILGIAPEIRRDLTTNLAALVNLGVLGAVLGYVLRRMLPRRSWTT